MEHTGTDIKRFNHLLGEMDAVYHDISLHLGLSDSISKILYTICDKGDHCPLSLICRQTGLSKQTVNSAIRKLEQQGVVRLAAVDGKAKDVYLTETGTVLANGTARRILQIENEILGSWRREDVEQYLALTERFLRSLQTKASQLRQEQSFCPTDATQL